MVPLLLQISDSDNHISNFPKFDKNESTNIYNGVEEMLEPEYTPEFIVEMQDIINGKHIGPFDNAYELDAYIRSLPDVDDE